MSHAHSHDRSGPTPHASRRLRRVVTIILIAAGLATAAGLVALWPDHGRVADASSQLQFTAPGTTFPTGRITALTPECPGYFDSAPSASSQPGDTRACQLATVHLLSGPSAGDAVSVPLLWPWASAGLQVGDELELVVPPQATDSAEGATGTQGVTVNGVVRGNSLLLWALVFVVVVVAVGLLRGLMALLALGFSAVTFIGFIVPAIISGAPGLAVAVVGGSAIMFVVLYLAHGVSLRTSAALIGTLFGIGVTAGVAQLAITTTHLTGVNGDVGGMLASVTQIDFRGLLAGAIVIAGLGVLNDVTVTQASAVWELRAASPGLSRRELFTRAMRIGRDHIASTIYTIAFAYAGAAMVVLVVLYLYDRSTFSLLSQEDLAAEVVRTLCSGIGLALAVPATTLIAVLLVPSDVVVRDARVLNALRAQWYALMPRTEEGETRRL